MPFWLPVLERDLGPSILTGMVSVKVLGFFYAEQRRGIVFKGE
jgi:hypothetical protein